MGVISEWWRPLVLGLAAAIFCTSLTFGQSISLSEQINRCNTCHGENGNSQTANMPSLAGQPAFFILNQLFLMREGVRRIEAMASIVKDLKDDELEALAKHYSKLPPKPSGEPIDPSLVKRGAELAPKLHCGSCHRPTLIGQDQMPRLANQRIDYMIAALRDLRDSKRSGADTLMVNAVRGLSDSDLAALAHYAASR